MDDGTSVMNDSRMIDERSREHEVLMIALSGIMP